MKYTIKQFKAQFPTDKTCLEHIFKSRYPEGLKCPKCGKKEFYPIENRRSSFAFAAIKSTRQRELFFIKVAARCCLAGFTLFSSCLNLRTEYLLRSWKDILV